MFFFVLLTVHPCVILSINPTWFEIYSKYIYYYIYYKYSYTKNKLCTELTLFIRLCFVGLSTYISFMPQHSRMCCLLLNTFLILFMCYHFDIVYNMQLLRVFQMETRHCTYIGCSVALEM